MQRFIDMSDEQWSELRRHLLHSDIEEAAVGFADIIATDSSLTFQVRRIRTIRDNEFAIHTAYHISLTDECRGSVIKEAWDSGQSLVEFHSHVDADHYPSFSVSDVHGFDEFVPHVFWRLARRPYAAVVVAQKGIDAASWVIDPLSAEPVAALRFGGGEVRPTGAGLRRSRLNGS